MGPISKGVSSVVNAAPTDRPQRTFALRFISGKYQGGEFPLPETGEIVIGRSSELDMVLVEDMVSRRHAKITVGDGKIFLQDLGSTNGSFVNGEKIKRAELNEGDRILIGTSIIKLIATEGGTTMRDAQARLADVAAAKRTSQVRTMTGDIAEVPLPDLLQLFAASKKSGVLSVSTDRDTGKIYLEDGRIIFATINDNFELPPIKSFNRIMTWPEGTFELAPPDGTVFDEPLQLTTEMLLMEAMRQLDELRRIESKMPPRHARLRLAQQLEARLRDLSPEELDVLQVAHTYSHMDTILTRSPLDDLQTGEAIMRLTKAGILEVIDG